MTAISDVPDVTDDGVLGGALRLLQPKRGHRFGHDAILLAAATVAARGDHVVEFGAGVGAAGLALAHRVPRVSLTLVELDPALATLAQRNAERNGLAERVTVINEDVAHLAAFPRSVSGVMMNPPFNEARSGTISPDPDRAQAHTGGAALLRSWMQAAARLLPAGACVTLIWRAEKAADVTAALEQEFGAVRVLPVHTRQGQSPTRILVQAIRGGAAGTVTLPAVHLANADGTPSALANAVLRHGAALPFLPAAGEATNRA